MSSFRNKITKKNIKILLKLKNEIIEKITQKMYFIG